MTNAPRGLRIETAASIVLRDMIHKYFAQFALVIRRDRAAALAVTTEFRNGYAGSIALAIAGGHAGKDDIITAEVVKLKEFIERDLAHLRKQ